MDNNITLYIATHNKTGLKYFGKTTEYFNQKDLQEEYHGSGKYWLNHLKKYGDDVTMEIYGIYSPEEVKKIALKFSEDNNIVFGVNNEGLRKDKKTWANLKPENGLDGGCYFVSDETKIKISNSLKEFYRQNGTEHLKYFRTKEMRKAMSEKKKGTICSEKTRKLLSEKGKGRIVSEETRKKISAIHKGKTVSEETKIKISNAKKGVKLSDKHKEALSKNKKGMKGLHHSEETKDKIRLSRLGKKSSHSEEAKANMRKPKGPQKKIICPYCNKEGGASNMKRWHFDNCKLKTLNNEKALKFNNAQIKKERK